MSETLPEITAKFSAQLETLGATIELANAQMRIATMQIQASQEIIGAMMVVNGAGQAFDPVLIREAERYLAGKVFQVLRIERRVKCELIHGMYAGPVTTRDLEDRFFHEYFGGRDAKLLEGNRFTVIRHLD